MLERQYATSHQLIMRIQLNNLETKIIKVGKRFNQYINEKFESIFPCEFSSVIQDILFEKDNIVYQHPMK